MQIFQLWFTSNSTGGTTSRNVLPTLAVSLQRYVTGVTRFLRNVIFPRNWFRDCFPLWDRGGPGTRPGVECDPWWRSSEKYDNWNEKTTSNVVSGWVNNASPKPDPGAIPLQTPNTLLKTFNNVLFQRRRLFDVKHRGRFAYSEVTLN